MQAAPTNKPSARNTAVLRCIGIPWQPIMGMPDHQMCPVWQSVPPPTWHLSPFLPRHGGGRVGGWGWGWGWGGGLWWCTPSRSCPKMTATASGVTSQEAYRRPAVPALPQSNTDGVSSRGVPCLLMGKLFGQSYLRGKGPAYFPGGSSLAAGPTRTYPGCFHSHVGAPVFT